MFPKKGELLGTPSPLALQKRGGLVDSPFENAYAISCKRQNINLTNKKKP
jgi:hypothetical protein